MRDGHFADFFRSEIEVSRIIRSGASILIGESLAPCTLAAAAEIPTARADKRSLGRLAAPTLDVADQLA